MRPAKSLVVVRILLAMMAFAIAPGCQHFDPSVDIQSWTQPEDQRTADGIWWVAIKRPYTQDIWCWVPAQASVLARARNPDTGFQGDLVINGRVYRVTSDGTSWTFHGFLSESGVDFSASEVLAFIGLGGLCVLCVLHASIAAGKLQHEKARASAAVEKLAAFKNEKDALRNQQAEFRKQERALVETANNLKQWHVAETERLADQQSAIQAAAREIKVEKNVPSVQDWEVASQTIRAKAFRGRSIGGGLVLDYFFDPKRSGVVIFQWEITLDRPVPPTIIGYRNGRKFHQESGMVKGEFSERLLKPNTRYRYKWKLCEGKHVWPDPVQFELTVPPFQAWEPPPPQVDSAAERKQKKEAWKRDKYAYAEGHIKDQKKLREKKAAIDEEANKLFGEG